MQNTGTPFEHHPIHVLEREDRLYKDAICIKAETAGTIGDIRELVTKTYRGTPTSTTLPLRKQQTGSNNL